MKKTLQEYLHFTRSERRGIFYLILLIVALFLLPWIYSFVLKEETPNYTAFEQEIEAWEAELLNQDSLRKSKYKNNKWDNDNKWNKDWGDKKYDKKTKVVLTPFPFNPNEASKEQLLDLGLPDRTVSTLLNFRDKGGKFYKKEDLKKVYGLKDEWYKELEPSIRIKKEPFQKKDYPNSDKKYKDYKKDKEPIAEAIPKSYEDRTPVFLPEEEKAKSKKKPNWKPVIVDVNTSSAKELQKVYGIGPSFAKRIVKYRESLGGFTKISQVSEVYGMPDSTYQKIKPGLKLESTASLKKININTASADELKTHPYLNWKVANAIVKYRKTHGDYTSVESLKKNYAISAELYEKLSPYLEANQ